MPDILEVLLLTFVPLLIAIDALGNLPLVLSLEEGMSHKQRRHLVNVAIVTASVVGLAFLLAGRGILRLLGISVGHFAIAGGLVLLALAMRDLVTGKLVEETVVKEELVAAVPVGTPLTVGPATLTTLLLLSDQYGMPLVLLSFALNMGAAWLVFVQGNRLLGFLGQGGLRAVSKVASLLLAAIGVRMIVRGLEQVLR